MPSSKSTPADAESLPAPLWWKRKVRAELKATGLNQTDLAKRIGGSQAGVSQALNETNAKSRYVRPICEFFGWPIPLVAIEEEGQFELMDSLSVIRERAPAIHASLVAQIMNTARLLEVRRQSADDGTDED